MESCKGTFVPSLFYLSIVSKTDPFGCMYECIPFAIEWYFTEWLCAISLCILPLMDIWVVSSLEAIELSLL